jgi:glyoxylase-like metal-dependent hydrolase (beta-lactamase superfamily II)
MVKCHIEFALRFLAKPSRSIAVAAYALAIPGLFQSKAAADLEVDRVQVAPLAQTSQVPAATARGKILAPQAISAVDICADGRFITVGTMAFCHDANVWQFGPDGTVLANRYFPPWAPMQVATLSGGRTIAVGLAYSRVTSPDPTVWFGRAAQLLNEDLKDEWGEADSRDGQLARLRPGSGDWRSGWFASHFGELFVRGPDWIFKPPAWFLDDAGRRQQLRYDDKNQLPTSRAMRMAASADGKRLAFGWIGFRRQLPDLPTHPHLLSVWQINPNRSLWSVPPTSGVPPELPNPVVDFPNLSKNFRLAPDTLLPGHVAASVAVNRDASRVAVVEYGIWGWVRTEPAIGKWNPPIHVLNFLPRQRGRLRVFDGVGKELFSELLPEDGMFEVGFTGAADEVLCWPSSWFARGMAGAVWLPVDAPARTLYRIAISPRTATAFDFPDAIADCAPSATAERTLVSCWDGRVYLLEGAEVVTKLDLGGAARLAWSNEGAFAVAGTQQGRLVRVEKNGDVGWSKDIPAKAPPALTQAPAEVVQGLPIFQGGRIPRGEHAYVGDIWIIHSGRNAVLVDCGGTSGFATTQARLHALGVDHVTHVLHTHTHGDHCGGAYLWRAAGAKMVAAKSAAYTLSWLMPMLTDYGIYPPRPLDMPLPLERVGDETEFDVSGLRFRALFVPGHSFDATVYMTELGGRRIAFTGDLGFENQDILHRCWGDEDHARAVVHVIREKVLSWQPDVVFTGHGVRTNGTEFITQLVRDTDESLARVAAQPNYKKPN